MSPPPKRRPRKYRRNEGAMNDAILQSDLLAKVGAAFFALVIAVLLIIAVLSVLGGFP